MLNGFWDFSLLNMTFVSIIASAAFCLLLTCFVIVKERTFVTTAWFGANYARTLKPGLQLKFPWPFELVDVTLSTKVQPINVTVTSMTADNAQIKINTTIHYTPKTGSFYQAAYALEDPEEQMMTYLDNFLRAQIKTLKVQEVFSSTTEFQNEIEKRLAQRFGEFGYKIENVLVGEPILSQKMADAYERKLIADQEQAAAVAEGQAVRTRMTMKAEAEGDSLIIKANAFKKMRTIIAEGNVEAINKFLEGSPDKTLTASSVLDFFAGLDEREAYRDASAHGGKSVYIGGGTGRGNATAEITAAITAAMLTNDEDGGKPASSQASKPVISEVNETGEEE